MQAGELFNISDPGIPFPRGSFLRIAEGIDVSTALTAVEFEDALWALYHRVKTPIYGDAKFIPLRGPDTTDDWLDRLDTDNYPIFTSDRMRPIAALMQLAVQTIEAREVGRVRMVKLPPGQDIQEHVESGRYARYFARFHIVLSGSPKCEFHSDETIGRFVDGDFFWMNHLKPWACVNRSPVSQIHLVFDATAPGYTGALG